MELFGRNSWIVTEVVAFSLPFMMVHKMAKIHVMVLQVCDKWKSCVVFGNSVVVCCCVHSLWTHFICIIYTTFNDSIIWGHEWFENQWERTPKEKALDNDFELAVITEFSLDDIFPQYIKKLQHQQNPLAKQKNKTNSLSLLHNKEITYIRYCCHVWTHEASGPFSACSTCNRFLVYYSLITLAISSVWRSTGISARPRVLLCPSNSLFDVCIVSVVGTTKNPAGIVLIL